MKYNETKKPIVYLLLLSINFGNVAAVMIQSDTPIDPAPHIEVNKRVPRDPKKRPSSYPFITGDTFRNFCDHIVDETNVVFNPSLVKKGDTIFVLTSYLKYFFDTLHEKIKYPYILVTHNDVFSVPKCDTNTCHTFGCAHHDFMPFVESDKLIAWFGKNMSVNHPKLFHIPLGMRNPHCQEGGNPALFKKYLDMLPIKKNGLIYMNFAVWTNQKERIRVEALFKGKAFCTHEKKKPFNHYIKQITQHKFVLSPEGNGTDCHRTWESLLMGSIPIITTSCLDPLFEELPALIIDDWEVVTQEYLDSVYEEMSHKTYDRKRLFADYWLDKIRKVQESARV